MSDALVRFIRRWRWVLLASWLIALAVAGIGSRPLPDRLSGGGWSVAGSQSAQVAEHLRHGFTGRGATSVALVIHDRVYRADAGAFNDRAREVIREVSARRDLGVRTSYGWADLSTRNRGSFIGKDRQTVLELLGLQISDGTARRVLPGVQADLTQRYATQGLDVSLVSTSSFWGEVNSLSEKGLLAAELVTLPLVLVILLLLYKSVVAALMSFAVGVTSIVFTLGVLTPLAQRYELSVFVLNAATMLGLGIGVDYSLFMISRFKEELRAGRTTDQALAATLRSSGETVIASGGTVLVAMSTLFLVPLNVIRSIALGSVTVVAFSVIASVVVLPVLLSLVGPRIECGRIPFLHGTAVSRGARWDRVARRIMRRPVLVLLVSVAGLLAIASPSLHLRTFTPDARIVPESSPVRAGYELVRDQFGVGYTAPIQVVMTSHTPMTTRVDEARLVGLRDRLGRLHGVVRVVSALDALERVDPREPMRALEARVWRVLPLDATRTVRHFASANTRRLVLEVIPNGYAASPSARAVLAAVRVEAARATTGDVRILVGGETAEGIDSNAVIQSHLPIVVVVMLVVSYLLLLLTFRSVFLPLKAILMNVLSLSATYGVLVLVFQDGWGSRILGVERGGNVQNFVPILLLTLLFSLSTDYEVFLLNRVREEFLATGDNAGSVAVGLARTAPLISGAAMLMIAVFGAFALTGILPIKQLGFGLAVAIALDATVVRLFVVPAAMRLMGAWNWWLPRRSRRGRSPDVVVTTPSREPNVVRPWSTGVPGSAVGPSIEPSVHVR